MLQDLVVDAVIEIDDIDARVLDIFQGQRCDARSKFSALEDVSSGGSAAGQRCRFLRNLSESGHISQPFRDLVPTGRHQGRHHVWKFRKHPGTDRSFKQSVKKRTLRLWRDFVLGPPGNLACPTLRQDGARALSFAAKSGPSRHETASAPSSPSTSPSSRPLLESSRCAGSRAKSRRRRGVCVRRECRGA
jgi:hypothetical protein